MSIGPSAGNGGIERQGESEPKAHSPEADTRPPAPEVERSDRSLDVARDSDVPISTQIYWQIAYQVDSGRLLPGTRLPPVRELGATLRVNPNTIRAVYRRLAETGYVTCRVGAGTRVAERPVHRRGSGALAGVVAELLRRAAQMGFTADEVAAATFAAAAERRRPSAHVRVLVAECTIADARHAATTIAESFPDLVEAEGALLEEVPGRLGRLHYDLVATTAFHGEEARELVAQRVPVVTMLVSQGYVDLLREVLALAPGAKVAVVCIAPRVVEAITTALALAGANEVEVMPVVLGTEGWSEQVDREADLVLLSREAIEAGAGDFFTRPERIREWVYELDPSGIELLGRAVDHVRASRDGLVLLPEGDPFATDATAG